MLNTPLLCQLEISDSDENGDQEFAETVARPQNEQCTDVGKNLDLDEAQTLYEH